MEDATLPIHILNHSLKPCLGFSVLELPQPDNETTSVSFTGLQSALQLAFSTKNSILAEFDSERSCSSFKKSLWLNDGSWNGLEEKDLFVCQTISFYGHCRYLCPDFKESLQNLLAFQHFNYLSASSLDIWFMYPAHLAPGINSSQSGTDRKSSMFVP